MSYAQLLLKHGPLKQAEISDITLHEQFYKDLKTLERLDPAFTKMMAEWASIKLPQKNSSEDKALLALMADPILSERIKFERRIAYEIVQLLIQKYQPENRDDPKFKIQALKIYATYRLYASQDIEANKYDLNPNIEPIVEYFVTQFSLNADQLNAGFLPLKKFLNAFGRIADKLVKQRADEQGVKDIQYALHFISLIMILEIEDKAQTLPFFNKWQNDRPVSFTGGYPISVSNIKISDVRRQTLIDCYHIIKNLLLEHTLVTNSSSSQQVAVNKLIKDFATSYLKDPTISTMQAFVDRIEKTIPVINNSSATIAMTAPSASSSSSSSSSRRTNNRANNNANLPILPPDAAALLLYYGPSFAVNNIATVANAAGNLAAAGADIGGGLDLGGCAMSIM